MKTILIILVLAACSSPRHTVRFANAPAVTTVDDRRDVPTVPASRPFAHKTYHLRGNVVRRVDRLFALSPDPRARGINALDEVPDSTWFTNRAATVTPDEVRNGPPGVGTPEAHLPWTIKSSKVGGKSIGFIIEDARGEKFILKFDAAGFAELETAADAIAGRLLWAVGYNVPEDHVVYFRRGDLVLGPGAKVRDSFGNSRPLRREDLDDMLAKIEVEADGRIRGLASKFLAGKLLGGHPDEGVRADDPNDRVPHELRRDTRGAKPIFAWLDHVDTKEDNTADVWVTDPADPKRHYVRHYLIDFGKSFGVMATTSRDPRRGHQYAFDVGGTMTSLVTLGLAVRPWETRTNPPLRGVGMYASQYDPSTWKPFSPSYLPFHLTDGVDGFWGAKQIMRLSRAHLQAAVEAGRYTDPAATQYLVDMLAERQRVTARYWFSQVAPLDNFTVERDALCFDDLMLAYELSPVQAITRYSIRTTDRNERAIGAGTLAPGLNGRTCTAPLALAPDGDRYTIVQIRTTRHAFDRNVWVHLARRDGATHVIGVWRQ